MKFLELLVRLLLLKSRDKVGAAGSIWLLAIILSLTLFAAVIYLIITD